MRQVFSSEIQKVGTAGAKVLLELGAKVERMEKLSPGDLLAEVHEAAEELQLAIDKKSYLLINAESWASTRMPQEFEDPNNIQELKDAENRNLVMSSLSQVAGHLRSMHTPRHPNMSQALSFGLGSSENLSRQQQWPSRLSMHGDTVLNEREVHTYESASALSLATFTSLLMEFVARLQNLVISFEELSEKAKFTDPSLNTAVFVE